MKSSYAKIMGALCCAALAAASLTGCPPAPTGTVPDVVGMMQAAAETAITDALMTVGTVTEVFDSAPAGEVLSQSPAAGETVAEGTAIDLTVSKGPDLAAIQANFDLSQHGTRQGKVTWWYGEEGEPGFSSLLEPDVDINDCTSCHAANYADGTPVDNATYTPGCADCHIDPANPMADPVDAPNVCIGCHGRQKAELGQQNNGNPLFSDVHRDAGMVCNDCHGFDEIHGDGQQWSSMLDSPSITCESCHQDDTNPAPAPPSDFSHSTHTATLDCSACHVQTVLTCYNCHIESLVDEHKKVAAGQPNGFILLMNRVADGKVYPGSFQSASYQGQKMIAIGGFYSHTITGEGRACGDCHDNANIESYDATGIVTLGTYDEATQKVTGPAGVVPIPPDYKDAIKLDFLSREVVDGTPTWSVIQDDATTTPDLVQMVPSLVAPLTPDQMDALGSDTVYTK